MKFSSLDEVQLAYSLGTVDTHAKIEVKLPPGRRVKNEGDGEVGQPGVRSPKPRSAACMFNIDAPRRHAVLQPWPCSPASWPRSFPTATRSSAAAATIDLLDDMNHIGFRESTRSGLSFATDDLITPPNKQTDHWRGRKEGAQAARSSTSAASSPRTSATTRCSTPGRTPANSITNEMMTELENDDRTTGYVNPIYLMAHSGARGGVEQIRQLAGMRGLMAKPIGQDHRDAHQGQLPRRPDGARVLQLHARRPQGSGRHGPQDGRLRLPHPQAGRRRPERRHHARTTAAPRRASPRASSTAAKRSKSAWPTRSAAASAATNIVNPITDEVIVRENELITPTSPARSKSWAWRRSRSAAR